jgi:hypothetical protein
MKQARIEHDSDNRYWIIIDSDDDDTNGVAFPIYDEDVILIKNACESFFLKSEE